MELQIHALARALRECGLRVQTHGLDRIYITGLGEGLTIYVLLEEPNRPAVTDRLFANCTLKVLAEPGDTLHHHVNRAKQIKHTLLHMLYDAGISTYRGVPLRRWQDVIL